jgi:hypothetical protein
MSKETIIRVQHLDNGSRSVTVDGRLYYAQYNTGDQVWFDMESTELKVVAGITHDGIGWGNVPVDPIYR